MFEKQKDLIKPCYKCKRVINVKYSFGKKAYSNKNNWEWWTEDEKNKNKYICNDCLSELFHWKKVEYLGNIKNKTKRNTIRNYMWEIRRIKKLASEEKNRN